MRSWIRHSFRWLKNKWVKRVLFFLVALPLLLFSILIAVVYWNQDYYVQLAIEKANQDLNGKVSIGGSHIALFENFPYVSVDLEDLKVYESKEAKADCLVHVKDAYVGFNLLDLLSGNYTVKRITLKGGHIDSKQHADGSLNIERALASKVPPEKVKEDLHLDLNSIVLEQVDLSHLDEKSQLKVDAMIAKLESKFTTNDQNVGWDVNTDFVLSVLQGKDSTFFSNKHCSINSSLLFDKSTSLLSLKKTQVRLEKTTLDLQGNVECKGDFKVDMKLKGQKPDFNLFLSFAPQEYLEALNGFDNKGKIYFNAAVKGKTLHGNNPSIDVRFGCSEGLIRNENNDKKIKAIGFEGYFTNGASCSDSTSLFYVRNIQLKPEIGKFQGDIWIKNFKTPEIKMDVSADLDLDFLSKFSQSSALKDVGGKVIINMHFHDMVDLEHPERVLQRFSDSYRSELEISDLHGKFDQLPYPITHLNLLARSKGHQVDLENLSFQLGNSEVQISGALSDLPAIIHHSSTPVDVRLNLNAKLLDFSKILQDDHGKALLNDQVKDLKLLLNFKSSAKSFTESKYLPQGYFEIIEASGKFQNYPHHFKNVRLQLMIDDLDLTLKAFRGELDHSDFSMSGKFHHYNYWFQPEINGKADVQLALHSKHLIFKELMSYGGVNHLPEAYRQEELSNFDFVGHASVSFNHGTFKAASLNLDKLSGKLKSHPLALHHFSGILDYDKDLISFQHLKGNIGNSDVELHGNYHLTNAKHRSKLEWKSKYLNLDALLSGVSKPSSVQGAQHDKVFSLYDYAFPNVDMKIDVGHFIYSPYDLKDLHLEAHCFDDHHIEVQRFKVTAAEGSLSGSGTFSGRDKNHIYFAPNIAIHHLNLDKFMVKFDNFGQDHLISENLHGYAEGTLKGKIHLHADFIPKLDDSDLEIDVQVTQGRLQNYAPLLDLGSYFEDKEVSNVKFDTLTNVFLLKHGKLSIPEMVICSSLGFLKISGEQSISGNMPMNYQVGIPWAMIKEVAKNKLFKNRTKDRASEEEVIVEEKNAKYLYLKVDGDLENYKISMVKKKKKK